jgi:hypothetical protein
MNTLQGSGDSGSGTVGNSDDNRGSKRPNANRNSNLPGPSGTNNRPNATSAPNPTAPQQAP